MNISIAHARMCVWQLTLGFQVTPVVCHCLTYFWRVSINSRYDLAHATAAGLLHDQLSSPQIMGRPKLTTL